MQKTMRTVITDRVRTQFNMVHLSDITTVNGKMLDKIFPMRREMSVLRNQYKWPEKYHVVTIDYTLWKSFLYSIV